MLTVTDSADSRLQRQFNSIAQMAEEQRMVRIWGGIHPPVDDFGGRRLGAQCGRGVWALARQYFDGSILQAPISLSMLQVAPNRCAVRFDTLRGFFYKLQSAPDLSLPFLDAPSGFTQALDSSVLRSDEPTEPMKFYRVIRAAAP
jgi:hypothetical protein